MARGSNHGSSTRLVYGVSLGEKLTKCEGHLRKVFMVRKRNYGPQNGLVV